MVNIHLHSLSFTVLELVIVFVFTKDYRYIHFFAKKKVIDNNFHSKFTVSSERLLSFFKAINGDIMTPTQSEILALLSENGLSTLSELSEITGKTKPNLSNILSRLIKKELVEKSIAGSFRVVNGIYSDSEQLHGAVNGSEGGESETANTVNDSESGEAQDANTVNNSDDEMISQLRSEIDFLQGRVLFLEKIVDQEQQLHALADKKVAELENRYAKSGFWGWLTSFFN